MRCDAFDRPCDAENNPGGLRWHNAPSAGAKRLEACDGAGTDDGGAWLGVLTGVRDEQYAALAESAVRSPSTLAFRVDALFYDEGDASKAHHREGANGHYFATHQRLPGVASAAEVAVTNSRSGRAGVVIIWRKWSPPFELTPGDPGSRIYHGGRWTDSPAAGDWQVGDWVLGSTTLGSVTAAHVIVSGGVQLGAVSAACTGGIAGTIRWANDRVELCNVDEEWVGIYEPPPPRSCAEINKGDGVFSIDFDGKDGPMEAMEVYCHNNFAVCYAHLISNPEEETHSTAARFSSVGPSTFYFNNEF